MFIFLFEIWWEYYPNAFIVSLFHDFPHLYVHSFGYCLPLFPLFVPHSSFFFWFAFLFSNSSFPCPSPSVLFPAHPSPLPSTHPFILDSIRGGEVLHIFACLPREDICRFLSRGQDKDYFIRSNTFKKHLQSEALTCRRREKKEKKKKRNHVKTTTTVTNATNKMLFVTLHGFLIIFPYFERKIPLETAGAMLEVKLWWLSSPPSA